MNSTISVLEVESVQEEEDYQTAILRVSRVIRASKYGATMVANRINERILKMRMDESEYVRDLAHMIPLVERTTVSRALKCERPITAEMLFRILRYGLELSLEECAYIEQLRKAERITQADLSCVPKVLCHV